MQSNLNTHHFVLFLEFDSIVIHKSFGQLMNLFVMLKKFRFKIAIYVKFINKKKILPLF